MGDFIYMFTLDGIIETTWAELKAFPQRVKTGTYIPFVLKNEEEVAVRAMHDGTGKLFFVLENCFPKRHRMNPTDTERGGWKDCEMRKWLNEEVFALLPDDLQKAIAATSVVTTGSHGGKIAIKDSLFLLSVEQVFGENTRGYPTPQEQLDWFTDERHHIKLDSEGNLCWWWLRSGFSYDYFYYVNSSGNYNYTYAYTSAGVTLGFCLNE